MTLVMPLPHTSARRGNRNASPGQLSPCCAACVLYLLLWAPHVATVCPPPAWDSLSPSSL